MRKSISTLLLLTISTLIGCGKQETSPGIEQPSPPNNSQLATRNSQPEKIRVATFNTALNRPEALTLATELETGTCVPAHQIAEIIQRVRPDILLLNEVDYDDEHRAATALHDKYLAKDHGAAKAINYPYRFLAPVNTGIASNMDLNKDGKTDGPEDAFGYGKFPGQYGMIVFSKFPIESDSIRTFQNFLWKDMPDAKLPQVDGQNYYAAEEMEKIRLSSKSHWDVPIGISDKGAVKTVHFLVSHPTPPVFDGPEDRNGTRNHDEIRFFADYVDSERSGYIYDDKGEQGGIAPNSHFVIAGDLNADPVDGSSTDSPMQLLLESPLVNSTIIPSSKGAVEASTAGEANKKHISDPASDTGNFGKRVGNLRIDYVLPSSSLNTIESGVYWPASNEPEHDLVDASDHRLVWIDIAK